MLLHGFTGSHFVWERLCDNLEDEYFIVLPDLPGHGNSAGVSDMNVDQTSDAILSLLDDLKLEKVALLGYSLGGRIALNFATRYEERLVGLILESASPGILDMKEREKRRLEDKALAEDARRYGLSWFLEEWENRDLFASQKSLPEDERQRVRNERLVNTAAGLANSLEHAGAGAMLPMWSKLGGLQMPVLLIAGEKDRKYLSIAEEMKERTSNCILKIIENAGHTTHLENYCKFNETVREFLQVLYHKN